MKRKSLERLQDEIAATKRGPYWHNIVGLILSMIAEYYGDDAANKTILKLGLDKKGWNVKK